MLYTNVYGCCRLFQTTIKNRKVPYLKRTDLNRIQVTTLTCNISVKQRYKALCWLLPPEIVLQQTQPYNENKYYVVTWTVYLESSMYLRRR